MICFGNLAQGEKKIRMWINYGFLFLFFFFQNKKECQLEGHVFLILNIEVMSKGLTIKMKV